MSGGVEAIPAGMLAMVCYQNNYETLGVEIEAADDAVARGHKADLEDLLEKEMSSLDTQNLDMSNVQA